MSRASRQRDSLAPSLFPFLAVLLCTMGALVLILMLVVSAAHASALQIAKQSTQEAEEVESQLALASHGFQKQLTEARLELEKKRLGLQHLENHIQELLDEVDQLKRTAELAEADEQRDETEQQAQVDAISLLEKQLLEASEKLKQKLDKPEGDKPIFAIIPYDGRNGTHRRPIYLECIEQGIRIQPEGVLLLTEDLEPPYGPGNPLDAALRTIRTQYAPANHAVTSTAYPLLIVRPSGIRSYAMARAAMGGWDDQFGYELIGEELELTFPEGEPGLAVKITRALELARERQAALIVAMPKKYRALSERDRPLSGGGSGGGTEGWAELGDYSSGETVGNGYGGSGYGDDNVGAGGSQDGSRDGAYGSGERGGWANASSTNIASGDATSAVQGDGSQSRSTAEQLGKSGNGPMGFGEGSAPGTNPAGSATGESFFGSASGGPSGGGYAGGPNDPNRSRFDPYTDSSRRNADGSVFGGLSGNSGAESGTAGNAGGIAANPGGTSSSQSAGGDSQASSNASNSTNNATGGGGSQMSGSQMAMPFNTPNQSGSSGSSSGSASQSASSSSGSPGNASQNSADMNGQQPAPQFSHDKNLNGQRQESATPVASRRGRGWAWSQGPPSQTSVGRSIRLQCLADRWIVLPDSGKANDPAAITITFDTSPQQRAEQLAKVVAERVDSWGIALSGGYWKPMLVVDVAADAQWRFNQLQQLLDGSGLDVQRSQ